MAYLTGEAGAARPASVFQPEQGERADVLTFLSDPLERDLAIAGSIRARLTVSTEAEDTAFTVTVMEVSPDGRAINIRDGITSLRYRNGAGTPQPYVPNEKTEVEIELWPMAWKMRKGSRIRVDVSSSNFPAYHAHPNLAGPWALQAETRIARQTVYGGTAEAAWLDLPITDGEEDRP